MKNPMFKSALLALTVAIASVNLAACGDDDNNDKVEKVQVTDERIQQKQGNQIEVFDAIKTMQGSFGEETAKNTFESKVAGKVPDNAKADLMAWLEGRYNNKDAIAMQGIAGKLARTPKNSNPRTVVVDANAVEYDQLIKKGLIGAYQLDNTLEELSKLYNGDADNEAVLANVTAYLLGSYSELAEGKGDDYYPGNEFEKYLKVVANNENFSSIEDDLYEALNEAREHLDEQEEFNKHMLEALQIAQKAVAVRAVHYLNYGAELESATAEGEFGNTAHAISEGLGLLYSLQYTYNPVTHSAYYNEGEVDGFLNNLDLWNKADAETKLTNMANDIAQKFGFDASKA